MPELDDKGTDKLFQTGAARHDFAYDPAAWAQMEGMLDAEVRYRRWRIVGGVLLLLGLLAGAWWYLSGRGEITPPVANGLPTVAAVTPAPADGSSRRPDASVVTKALATPSTQAPADKEAGPISTGKASPRFGADAGADIERPSLHTESPRSAASTPGKVGAPNETTARQDNPPATLRTTRVTAPIAVLSPQALPLPAVKISDARMAVRPATDHFRRSLASTSLAATVGGGLIYGMVDKSKDLRPQLRYTAGLEYRLGRRLSFGTGVAFNSVVYESPGEAYDPKDDSWVRGVVPTSVEAHCQVLEIPLSATFYPKGNRNSGLYGSAGAINYLLLKESYAFNYAENGSDLKQAWTGKNANNHFFGVGHLNLGYQLAFNGRSALRLETYVHVPLTGIGQGQTRLLNGGVSVNYLFGLGRR